MAGAFDSIFTLLEDITYGLAGNDYAWYAILLIGGTISLYQLLYYSVFERFMEGKGGKAASLLITILVIGGLFYSNTAGAILLKTGLLAKFLLFMVLGVGVMIFSVKHYMKHKNSENKNIARVIMFSGLLFSSALLRKEFGSEGYLMKVLEVDLSIFTALLDLLTVVAMVGLVISFVRGITSVFGKDHFNVGEKQAHYKIKTLKNSANEFTKNVKSGNQLIANIRHILDGISNDTVAHDTVKEVLKKQFRSLYGILGIIKRNIELLQNLQESASGHTSVVSGKFTDAFTVNHVALLEKLRIEETVIESMLAKSKTLMLASGFEKDSENLKNAYGVVTDWTRIASITGDAVKVLNQNADRLTKDEVEIEGIAKRLKDFKLEISTEPNGNEFNDAIKKFLKEITSKTYPDSKRAYQIMDFFFTDLKSMVERKKTELDFKKLKNGFNLLMLSDFLKNSGTGLDTMRGMITREIDRELNKDEYERTGPTPGPGPSPPGSSSFRVNHRNDTSILTGTFVVRVVDSSNNGIERASVNLNGVTKVTGTGGGTGVINLSDIGVSAGADVSVVITPDGGSPINGTLNVVEGSINEIILS